MTYKLNGRDFRLTDVAGEVNDTVVGTVGAGEVTVSVNGVPAEVMNRGFRAENVAVGSIDPTTNAGEITVQAVDAAGNQAAVTISPSGTFSSNCRFFRQ